MMQKEKSKRSRQTEDLKKEHKPNWKEYTAMPEDIKAFLADRIFLRHNVITKRVECRIPSSYENDGTDWQPITDRIVNSRTLCQTITHSSTFWNTCLNGTDRIISWRCRFRSR